MICFNHKYSYLCYGYDRIMRLEYNSAVYKNLLYPALGTLRPNQAGYFNFISSISKIEVYIENVSFFLSRAATLKKEIFNKSTTCFMSLRAMTSRCQLAQQGHNKKIDLVIKMSKQFRFFSWQIFRGLKFLVS